ncbi:MAG: restriction endonuclease, partial [Candidatus Nephrothrix sp. EaCA]
TLVAVQDRFFLNSQKCLARKKYGRVSINIENLNNEIARIVKRQNELRAAIDEIVKDIEGK